MKTISDWAQQIFYSPAFRNLQSLHAFDLIFIAFLLIGVLYGMKRGFLRMIIENLEFCAVIFFTMDNYEWLALWITQNFRKASIPESLALGTAFFFLLTWVWAAVLVIDLYFKQWVVAKTQPVLRIAGGAILGSLYFFLIFVMVSKGLYLIPNPEVQHVFWAGHSHYGPDLVNVIPDLYRLVTIKLRALLTAP